MARVAEGLTASWNTANNAVLAEGKRVLINEPGRFDGVEIIGSTSTCGGTPAAATTTSP